MALINRPFPGLFGGVSQQIPALRHATQCEVLDNAYVSLVDGLTKRPGLRHVTKLTPTGITAGNILDNAGFYNTSTHIIDQGDSERYVVIVRNGDILVYNLETGAVQEVLFPDGKGYLASPAPTTSFRLLTVADFTFVVNQDIQCLATTVNTWVNPDTTRYARVLEAHTGVIYTIKIDAYTYSYTALAADDTNSIATSLAAGLDTAAGAGYTIQHNGYGVIQAVKTTAVTSWSITDGWGELATLNMSVPVKNFSSLPPKFSADYVIEISTDEIAGAAYYVEFNTVTEKWVETKGPSVALSDTLTATTMPHLLVHNADDTWTFKKAAGNQLWGVRLVGDDDSNPLPSFVNGYITDVFFFRNRLGFLTADTVCMSKAGSFYDFFSDTAREVLDTDPIDVTGTSPDVLEFQWAVPYNERLLIYSDRAQWDLSASDILSPRTVKLSMSTRYDSSAICRPQLVGSDVFFATTTTTNNFSRIYRYRLADNAVTNRAEDLTDHCPEYLQYQSAKLVVSAARKQCLVLTKGFPNYSYMLKWEENDEKLSQKAWGRWTLPDNGSTKSCFTKDAHWVGNKLYMLNLYIHPTEFPAQYGQWCIEYMDFEDVRKWTVEAPAVALEYFMDRKVTLSATSYDAGTNLTTYTLPYQDNNTQILWKLSGTDTLGGSPATAAVTVESGGTTLVKFTGNLMARTCTFGYPYAFKYQFSEISYQDNQGIPVASSRLRIKRLTMRFDNTGYFVAKVSPSQRATTYQYPMNGVTIGSTAINSDGIARGHHIIPVGSSPENCTITLENTTTYLPTRIPYGEWTGELLMRSQR